MLPAFYRPSVSPSLDIAAIVRGSRVMATEGETRNRSGDHVVLLLGDKRHLHELERIFQVGLR